MTFPLAYCPHGDEVLGRLRRLFEERSQDVILAVMEVPSRALARFAERHPSGYCQAPDLDDRVRFWDDLLSEQAAVLDDSIPAAYLSEMDQGLYGALVGGDVRFLCDADTGWISSMVPPVLGDWSQFDRLTIRRDHPWFQRYLHQLEVFVTAARGRFGVSHFILISGLNFLFELVGGTQTYFDLSDHPDRVRHAIQLGFDLNVTVQEAFFEHVPLLEGGTCSNMAQWLPGRVVSESVDPFHMTSVDHFERWGRQNLERIFSRFDGGVLHLHGNGRHLLDAVATVRRLKAVYLLDDTGYRPAFEILAAAKERTGDLPLVVGADYASFQAALAAGRLPGGVLYRVRGVPDVAAANRCMDLVRACRP